MRDCIRARVCYAGNELEHALAYAERIQQRVAVRVAVGQRISEPLAVPAAIREWVAMRHKHGHVIAVRDAQCVTLRIGVRVGMFVNQRERERLRLAASECNRACLRARDALAELQQQL